MSKQLAQNVRIFRIKRRMSQKDLASAVGTSHSRISDIERGTGNPTLKTIEAIAAALGTSVERLVREKMAK
jgi:transcriptional regulator with XRE-family HTH domain